MRIISVIVMSCLFFAVSALADDGLVRLQSNDTVTVTAERLQKVLKEKGLRIFARIDHQKGAASVEKKLRPTEVFIFGNPKAGTPLMQCKQTIGIDLPQKILLYEDEQGKTWVVYNAPAYLAGRHGLGECGAKTVAKVTNILAKVSHAAAGL
ncbi:MAG TPA: DUF302 domain-containing protein [Desulfobulbaceae bacterium]|nr:DUF302 domain-containing protein [Desulfobulbaceae bacterium]